MTSTSQSPRESAVSAFFSKQSSQISRKLGILQQIPTFPSNIYILNKHPRQSWSKDCSPAAYQHSKESLPHHIKAPPGESNPVPQEGWNPSPQAASLSPVDSGSLSLAEHERVVRLYLKSYFLNRI